MRWRPRNIGKWRKRFLVIPKICDSCGCKFCLEFGWKVKREVLMRLLGLEQVSRNNNYPIEWKWFCNSCRKQHRDKKIQDLATRFRLGPNYGRDIVGQLLGFTGNAVPTKATRNVRKLKVK
jgi:hypothetical protein